MVLAWLLVLLLDLEDFVSLRFGNNNRLGALDHFSSNGARWLRDDGKKKGSKWPKFGPHVGGSQNYGPFWILL